MSQSAKAQEPSMEEILASIRRIIADDDTKPSPKAPEPPRPAPAAAAPARPAAPPPPPVRPPAPPNKQDAIDAVLANMDAPPAPPKAAPKPAAPAADVLDLTEAMTAAPPAPPSPTSFRTIDGASDVVFAERGDAPEAPRQPAPSPAPALDRGLMSASTRSAVDSAFNSLANTVLGNNARTLEDLVKEMLRPMLKTWLDDNLPGMVERIVRAEIERVSRGR